MFSTSFLAPLPRKQKWGNLLLRLTTGWSIWRIPRFAVTLVLLVDAAAPTLAVLTSGPVEVSHMQVGASLAGLSITYSVLSYTWERARRALWERNALTGQLYRNLLAVWCFAAAVTLPTSIGAAVVVLSAIAEWPSLRISAKALPHRYIYSIAGSVLALTAAHGCVHLINAGYEIRILVAAGAYMVTGLLTVVAAQFAVGLRNGYKVFLRWEAHRLELITLVLGAGLSALILTHHELFLWVSMPVAIAVQRWAVKSELHKADDPKDGPMSQQSWLLVAREVIRACPVGAIMRIETPDPAAATALARIKAGCDAIGMTGKSGLAVLLTQCPGDNADALADRMRAILKSEGINGEVAVAAKPRDGFTLDDLLAVSEAELIARVAATRPAKSEIPEV